MCAKFNRFLSRFIPEGGVKDEFRSLYYSLYYNRKHFKENAFCVYYKKGSFEYEFEDGVRFKCLNDIADELKRSLGGYLYRHRLGTGEVVVDCGSYVGEFTMYAARAVGPSGRVIAFEPSKAAYKELVKNVELNGFTNVISVNKGVWSADTVLKFNDRAGTLYCADGESSSAVTVASLDNELERLGVRKVDFIKMDVEGAELEAVKGAERTLKTNNVRLAVASYHIVNGKKTCFELERMFAALGYNAETAYPGHLTTYAGRLNK